MSDDPRQETTGAEPRTGRRISVGQVIGAIVLVVFVIFLVENNHKVKVRLIIPEKSISLSLALLAAGLLGAIALLLLQYRRRKKD
jgi:uncharacterized integral membrane protein